MFEHIDMAVHCNPGQIGSDKKQSVSLFLLKIWYS